MGTSDAPGTRCFPPQRYIPDQFEIDRLVKHRYEKLTRQFIDEALYYRYCLRHWKTYAALLFLSEGRPSFRVALTDIVKLSGQARMTTCRALSDLAVDGWIIREPWKLPGSYKNGWTKYTLTHLTPPR